MLSAGHSCPIFTKKGKIPTNFSTVSQKESPWRPVQRFSSSYIRRERRDGENSCPLCFFQLLTAIKQVQDRCVWPPSHDDISAKYQKLKDRNGDRQQWSDTVHRREMKREILALTCSQVLQPVTLPTELPTLQTINCGTSLLFLVTTRRHLFFLMDLSTLTQNQKHNIVRCEIREFQIPWTDCYNFPSSCILLKSYYYNVTPCIIASS
jgi:hypothetical protein